MHHCLQVNEIVEHIARFTEIASNDSPKCPSVTLAQVCKAFYEPALRMHWRTLETLRPLMACFPQEVCEADEKGNYHFKRNPSPQDWRRFHHHASQVRVLHCSDDNLGIGADEYRILDTCRPNRSIPLLPNLHELYWDDFRTPVAPFARLFIQPSLTTFHIISVSNPRLIASFLNLLASDAPYLKRLRIRSPASTSGNELVAQALERALPVLRSLTDVSVPVKLNATHMMELASLPSLEILSAPLDPEVDVARLFANRRVSFFPSLKRLDICAARLHQVACLVRAISSMTLYKAGAHLEIQPSCSALHDYFGLLAQHRRLCEVSVLMRSSRTPLDTTSSDYVLGGDTLSPLLRLHGIKRVYMIQFPFCLTDDFMRDASEAWPSLESLTLGTMVRSKTSGVTLEGLRPLAYHCSHLRELAIAIDIPSTKAPAVKKPLFGGLSPLKSFDIGCTTVSDDERLVRFVATLFPHVKLYDIQGSLEDGRKRLVQTLNNGVGRIHDGDSE
ncbi:hypothetical protein EIP86_006065 [Pleurotus ostreatoroseus]|nr:hypothetical protein EIP86_006065 [Pleurotus ostreatoroseus]